MAAGPIGSCWATGSWPDTTWTANTWAGATPIPPLPPVQPPPSSLHLPYVPPVTSPGFPPPPAPFVLPNVIGGVGRTRGGVTRVTKPRVPATDTRERTISGTLDYRLALTLTGTGTVTTTRLSGTLAYTPIALAMTAGRGTVDVKPAIEEEAFLLGLLLGDDDD